jgi:signal transduction histidine kinase/DNA-binding response OmpR family regulator
MKKLTFKLAFLIPLITIMLILTSLLIYGLNKVQNNNSNSIIQQKSKAFEYLYNFLVDSDAEHIGMLFDYIEQNADIEKAFLSRNREELFNITDTTFLNWRKKYKITHFYFITPEDKCFLRVHSRNRKDDIIKRNTLIAAKKTGKIAFGVELGVMGTLTLRVVKPWYINGKLIGYVELGEEIDHMLAPLEKSLGCEIFILLKKKHLNRKRWEEGVSFLKRESTWDYYDNNYILVNDSSNIFAKKELFDITQKTLQHGKQIDNQTDSHKFHIGKKYYISKATPYSDMTGKRIGIIILVKDITVLVNSEHGSMISFIIIIISSSLIIIILFLIIIGKIEKKLFARENDLKANNIELTKAKDEAEQASRAKADFLASMSHELRTPINGLIGSVELLQDTKITEEQQELLCIAHSSGIALLNLISDILDISKIEAEKIELDIADFDLTSLIEEIVPAHTMKAAKNNIEFIFRIHPDIPLNLQGDSSRIRQILSNFCSNAVKFTPKGQIYLKIRPDREHDKDNDKLVWIRFSVKDTGIGISEENQKKLFSNFTQADSSTTRKYGGTGLGLAISKRLIELMGGKVGINSEEGKGSEFYFTLPLKISEKSTKERRVELLENIIPKNYRILIVDDIKTNRIIVIENLKKWGFTYKSASSGKEALTLMRNAVAENNPFQIALLDYMMPEMNGMELAKIIKSTDKLKETKLIILTSVDNIKHKKDFRKLGFAGYFCKPIRSSILYNALLTVITGKYIKQEKRLLTESSIKKVNKPHHPLHIHILLAEDDLTNQIIATKMLEKLNCTLDIANNGKEAVLKVENNKYDIVFMDCQMPVMDGYEATRKIRTFDNKITIIAMTANALTGDKEKCLDAGMNDFISKPFTQKTLSEIIHKWTENN